jgi:hypothetical protein
MTPASEDVIWLLDQQAERDARVAGLNARLKERQCIVAVQSVEPGMLSGADVLSAGAAIARGGSAHSVAGEGG